MILAFSFLLAASAFFGLPSPVLLQTSSLPTYYNTAFNTAFNTAVNTAFTA